MNENTFENIIEEVKNKKFRDFKSFKIKKIYIKLPKYQKIISNLNNEENCIYFNYKSLECDTISIIDKDKRYIYLEDDLYDMTNKGIDSMTQFTILE